MIEFDECELQEEIEELQLVIVDKDKVQLTKSTNLKVSNVSRATLMP
jgi:hypothetical protein